MTKLLGGQSQTLALNLLDEFDFMMYEMVTNLDGLTTGTAAYPGWSPEKETKPSANPKFKGKTLWPYGEGGCAPQQKSSNMEDVNRIVSATKNKSWDGVDFDDECNMNVPLVIETMKQLKQEKRGISFRFIAGYIYNHLHTENGKNRITK